MRYSRKQTEGGKDLYIATTLILVAELIKFVFCLILLLIQKSGSFGQLFKTVASEVIFKPWETAKLAIPSSLYTIQNNLILLALSSLDAATFQVFTFRNLNIGSQAIVLICLFLFDRSHTSWKFWPQLSSQFYFFAKKSKHCNGVHWLSWWGVLSLFR